MRHLALLLCLALLAAAESAPADLGGPAPGLAGLAWRGDPPPHGQALGLVFWAADDGVEQPVVARVIEFAGRQAGQLCLALVCDGDGEPATLMRQRQPGLRHAIATADERAHWLGSPDSPLPAGALVGADGVLLWRGHASGLVAAVARERSGGYDRAKLAEAAKLRGELRALLAADHGGEESLAKALALTGRILALDPVDEEAIHLRLDLCHHLDKRDDFRRTLAALPLTQVPATLAAGLAWDRATDENLAWRNLDLALRLAEHACALEPDDAGAQDTHARILSLLGLFDEAIAAQLKAVSLAPDDAEMQGALDYYREAQALRAERLKGGKGLPAP